VFHCCVGLAAYVGAGSGEPVTGNTNHLMVAELPWLRASMLAGTQMNGKDWVSGTSTRVASRVSIDIVVERHVLVGM